MDFCFWLQLMCEFRNDYHVICWKFTMKTLYIVNSHYQNMPLTMQAFTTGLILTDLASPTFYDVLRLKSNRSINLSHFLYPKYNIPGEKQTQSNRNRFYCFPSCSSFDCIGDIIMMMLDLCYWRKSKYFHDFDVSLDFLFTNFLLIWTMCEKCQKWISKYVKRWR